MELMKQFSCLLLVAGIALAQVPSPKSFVGTIAGFSAENAKIEIRPDKGDPLIAEVTPDTIAQKVAPGSRDLKGAVAIKVTDVAVGDRVLVTLEPGTLKTLRIVVMAVQEIAQHNEADRRDWEQHGLSGIVAGKSGNRITVKTSTAAGQAEAAVIVDEQTSFKRYAPDSVKFTDAKPSRLGEISVGDQLRARGEKSADGLKVTAREVVFGTFLVKAGTIVAVNPDAHEIKIKELGTNRPLTIVLTADSQMKQMPSFPAGMAAPGRSGMPPGPPPGMPGGRGLGPGGGAPGGLDINQMIERMPPATLPELKPGSQLVVSSTKGVKGDQLTAIVVLANADMLIQMASAMSNNGRGETGAGMVGPGMSGMIGGDLSSLGLSGMIMQ